MHPIMLNYNTFIEEIVLAIKKLHGLVEIWPIDISNCTPIDILKWTIYDTILYLKTARLTIPL
jgi:hypothetical protein